MESLTLDLSLKQLEGLQKDVDDCFRAYVTGQAKKGRRPLAAPTTDQPAGRLVEVDTGGEPIFIVLVGLEYIPAEPEYPDCPAYPHDCEWDRHFFAVKVGEDSWWFEADFSLGSWANNQITEQLAEEFEDAKQSQADDDAERKADERKGW